MMVTEAGSGNLTTSATSQAVMADRRGRRLAFSITNYGATTAWVNMSNTQVAAVGTGVPIYPGTTLSDSNNTNYQCWQGTITAVDNGAGGATTLAFWERVEL